MFQKTESQIYRDATLEVMKGVLSTAQNVVEVALKNPHIGYSLNISGDVRQNNENLSETETTLNKGMTLHLLSNKGELIFYKDSTNLVKIADVDLAANQILFNHPNENLSYFEVLTKKNEGYGRKILSTEDVLKIYAEVVNDFTGFKGHIFFK